ncbi:MAG: hypothetical protein K2I07_06660 [Lachnospiraceae bacterium]|nr:hypothetical protein [Lachnospiraceae bacterium]
MNSDDDILKSQNSLDMLIVDSVELIRYARKINAKQVNLMQLMTYYTPSKWIVEEQQERKERTKYEKRF